MKTHVVLFLSFCLLQGAVCTDSRVVDERMDALEKNFHSLKENFQSMEENVKEMATMMRSILAGKLQMSPPATQREEPQLNATVEERLTLLELQVGDLDNDLNGVEDEIILISSDQILQDQKILDLQVASNGFEETVEQLFGADVSLRGDLDSLNSTVDERLQAQEVAGRRDRGPGIPGSGGGASGKRVRFLGYGTVAFKADLDQYISIPFDSPVVFEVEELNIGGGYSPVTGEFTVPPGGGGLYFLYVNLVSDGENSSFYLRVNGQDFCRAQSYDPGSFNQISCGFTYILEDGDVVDVFYSSGTDDTPIADGSGSHNAFTGFRIAPQ